MKELTMNSVRILEVVLISRKSLRASGKNEVCKFLAHFAGEGGRGGSVVGWRIACGLPACRQKVLLTEPNQNILVKDGGKIEVSLYRCLREKNPII